MKPVDIHIYEGIFDKNEKQIIVRMHFYTEE